MRAAFLLELKVPLPKCWCETNVCSKNEKEGAEKKGVRGRGVDGGVSVYTAE